MSKNEKDLANRYLILLRNDAYNLFHRINDRRSEFVDIFSLKRDRSIFKEVFRNRYEGMSVGELSHFSVEIIELANKYYQDIDELYWYLEKTQDMPNTIEDEVIRSCNRLEGQLENVLLYIDAELSGKEPELPSASEEFLPLEDNFPSEETID